MDDSEFTLLLISVFFSLVFSAFFSGMEIAFVSSNKLKIELDKKLGLLPARIYSFFIKHQSKFISTLLLGNNIALVMYGIFMARLLEPQIIKMLEMMMGPDNEGTSFELLLLLVQTIVSTLVILIFAEFIPKAVFRENPNRKLGIFTFPVAVFCGPLFALVSVVFWLLGYLMRLFNVDMSEGEVLFGKVDLDNYLKEATAKVSEEEELETEVQIFQNARKFSKVKARECMVPRNEIIALDVNDSVEELKNKFVETGLTKILIFRDSIDNIIGYVHSYELFKNPQALKNILLPIAIVPETMQATDILEQFIKQKKSIVVVVDEFGGTSGMVTIEDVVEEIFGEIEDEHDQENLFEKQLNNREYEFSARLEIDYLNEKYKLGLPVSEEYETIAGLIISACESIPEENEKIDIEPFVFEIKMVSDNRIDLVKMRLKEET